MRPISVLRLILCYMILYYGTVLDYSVVYHVMVCDVMLCYVTLYYVLSYYIIHGRSNIQTDTLSSEAPAANLVLRFLISEGLTQAES